MKKNSKKIALGVIGVGLFTLQSKNNRENKEKKKGKEEYTNAINCYVNTCPKYKMSCGETVSSSGHTYSQLQTKYLNLTKTCSQDGDGNCSIDSSELMSSTGIQCYKYANIQPQRPDNRNRR